MSERYTSFSSFYPFYLSQHSNLTCRRLHVVGSTLFLLVLGWAVMNQAWAALALLPVIGYGFAWVGHFFFEKNRTATFKYPLWSLMGDWRMFFETVSGRRKF